MIRFAILCLLASAYLPTIEEHQLPVPESVQSYLNGLVRDSKTPGIQYLVVASEQTVFEYVGGWANIAGNRPMDPGTTLMAYSMSKTITAVAVLQLAEAQIVNLDESIDRYLDLQPYGPGITIRELLSHTSGIPNPIPLTWVHPVGRHDGFNENAELATVLREHPRLSFAPGSKYGYSNIGYWLLGRIVERASGETFTSYVTDHVLRRLAIEPQDLGYVIPDPRGHAHGYLEKYSFMNLFKRFLVDSELIGGYEGRWLQIRSHYLNGPAFGGLVGTARGFGKFLQDQLRPHSKLFSDSTREIFYAPGRTKQGTAVSMTLGWHIGSVEGVRFFYKEGGGGGFHSMMRVYPAFGTATVVMTNATSFNVRGLLDTMDPRFLHSNEQRL